MTTKAALSKLDISYSPLFRSPPSSAGVPFRKKPSTGPPTNPNSPQFPTDLPKSASSTYRSTATTANPVKERTYDLPTIIETDPERRATFKYFVMDDNVKNTEKDKKRIIVDFHVKRDTDLEEIQLQQQTRLNVVEWRKKGRGTMFMSELWDSTFYLRVLRASGLDKIIDQIRRSRYQHKSRVGKRLEKEYKNKHSKQLEIEANEHKALIKTSRVQSARTTSVRPTTYSFGTSTYPNSPNLIPYKHFEFNTTTEGEEETATTASNAKRLENNLQDALYPMLIKEKHNRIKRGSKIFNTQIIKSARSTANPGQSDLLSLNLLGDHTSEAVASLTHLDSGNKISRANLAKSHKHYSLKLATSPSNFHLKTEESSMPVFMKSARETTEPHSAYKLDSPATFREPRVKIYTKSVVSSKIGGQLKDILNQCHEVKENNVQMMNSVNQLHDLLETGTQTRKSLRQAKESLVKKEEIKQESEKANPQRHYRKCMKIGRKSTGPAPAKGNNHAMEVYGW